MDPGHCKIMYSCGKHVESQCRCMDNNKPVIIGTTSCLTCTAPTAKELLAYRASKEGNRLMADGEIVSRVEAVLALGSIGPQGLYSMGWKDALTEVRRILDGGKP